MSRIGTSYARAIEAARVWGSSRVAAAEGDVAEAVAAAAGGVLLVCVCAAPADAAAEEELMGVAGAEPLIWTLTTCEIAC
jgi:hypothetical protein